MSARKSTPKRSSSAMDVDFLVISSSSSRQNSRTSASEDSCPLSASLSKQAPMPSTVKRMRLSNTQMAPSSQTPSPAPESTPSQPPQLPRRRRTIAINVQIPFSFSDSNADTDNNSNGDAHERHSRSVEDEASFESLQHRLVARQSEIEMTRQHMYGAPEYNTWGQPWGYGVCEPTFIAPTPTHIVYPPQVSEPHQHQRANESSQQEQQIFEAQPVCEAIRYTRAPPSPHHDLDPTMLDRIHMHHSRDGSSSYERDPAHPLEPQPRPCFDDHNQNATYPSPRHTPILGTDLDEDERQQTEQGEGARHLEQDRSTSPYDHHHQQRRFFPPQYVTPVVAHDAHSPPQTPPRMLPVLVMPAAPSWTSGCRMVMGPPLMLPSHGHRPHSQRYVLGYRVVPVAWPVEGHSW
ncbi:hypothetical protein HK102_003247 [Quaeritorhiza haematococci]|nr:hypothetical protein HK102_003247 [Quaeritorhiza haematococci]